MKSLDIIDCGRKFGFLVKGNQYTGLIPYGEISLMISTIDFDELKLIAKEYKAEINKNHYGANDIDALKQIFLISRIHRNLENNCNSFNKGIIPIIIDFLSLGDEEPSVIKNATVDGSFLTHIKKTFCIPDILLIDKRFQDCVMSILQRTENLNSVETFFSKVDVSTSLKINEDDTISVVYHFTDILSFVMLDLQRYLEENKEIRACERCGRPYLPKSGKNKRYCHFPNKGTNKSCAQLQRLVFDEFALVCRRARSNQKGFVDNVKNSQEIQGKKKKYAYDIDLLNREYLTWQEQLCIVRKECKDSNDIQRLLDWVNKTKFNKDRLKELRIIKS